LVLTQTQLATAVADRAGLSKADAKAALLTAAKSAVPSVQKARRRLNGS
jgi:hypothetical protein